MIYHYKLRNTKSMLFPNNITAFKVLSQLNHTKLDI